MWERFDRASAFLQTSDSCLTSSGSTTAIHWVYCKLIITSQNCAHLTKMCHILLSDTRQNHAPCDFGLPAAARTPPTAPAASLRPSFVRFCRLCTPLFRGVRPHKPHLLPNRQTIRLFWRMRRCCGHSSSSPLSTSATPTTWLATVGALCLTAPESQGTGHLWGSTKTDHWLF